MRNGKTDKRNGAAECRGRCREQTGDDEQQIAGEFNVYSQIGSITVTEQQGIEWFYQKYCDDKSDRYEKCEIGQLLAGDSAEISHTPNRIGVASDTPSVPPQNNMTKATPKLAPVSIPNIEGPASGLLNAV